MPWLFVFIGGGLGSLARYGVGQLLPSATLEDGQIPWFTLVANLLACVVLGLGVGWVSKDLLSKELQLLLLTGFCGGFSTFSTFALELVLMGEEGHWGSAAVYLGISLAGGVLAIVATYWLVR
ncbi:fluoride efflux transporter CrcB [Neolewinella aurantiaca]|uniref:Fluoride-specific ion channel FluC n=1 Tax=Neolewinella aurantiaca TaxID=2602767 RepID=A0A5C7FCV0_9BACT|nr:fluoride efflux transporter CrcB [Neolewinella aurantiaca]TXF88796.1 fluoride efflux transporter CrcB [Neolewinella aurantiaca]